MRSLTISLAILSLGAPAAAAQGVPLLSVEMTGGTGRHTLRTDHLYYEDAKADLLRAGATVRLWTPTSVAPVLSVDYSSNCLYACGHKAVCRLAPDGGCFEWLDGPSGTSVALGGSGTWRRINGTMSVGRGWYPERATYIDGSIALAAFSHVGVVADARRIVTTDDRGDPVWMFPISLGLRFF
jgi:hypothetical protein